MRRSRPAILLAALVMSTSLLSGGAASAQDADIESVIVRPATPDPIGPNQGAWFVFEVDAGDSAIGRALVHNPAEVEQVVKFAIADLAFNEGGSPDVAGDDQLDVGAWGTVQVSEAVIPARANLTVSFRIDVPDDAEPGDHIGVFMATTSNAQGQFAIERRIARRLYVTVPGDVTPSWEIEKVELTKEDSLFPGTAAVLVQLRNTGRIRVRPTVLVDGEAAEGSHVLLTKSVEQYHAQATIPWWGGPVNVPVEVTTTDGSVRLASASIFVIPVGLIASALLSLAAIFALRFWLKRRVSRTSAMRQDIERLERLLVDRSGGVVPAPVSNLTAQGESAEPAGSDRRLQLLQVAQRARRAGDHAGLAAVAIRLHDLDHDALELLLESAGIIPTDTDALLHAAATYGEPALSSKSVDDLHADQLHLLERLVVNHLREIDATNAKAMSSGHAASPEAPAPARELRDVPGLGETKEHALLEHFGSAEAVRQASAEELIDVKGIGPALATKVAEHLSGVSV
ncbi:MAG: hypothetical protein ACI867_001512 [Glaciecola sp.]|jgi:membrane protein implicated in regulation of membrane protease activity